MTSSIESVLCSAFAAGREWQFIHRFPQRASHAVPYYHRTKCGHVRSSACPPRILLRVVGQIETPTAGGSSQVPKERKLSARGANPQNGNSPCHPTPASRAQTDPICKRASPGVPIGRFLPRPQSRHLQACSMEGKGLANARLGVLARRYMNEECHCNVLSEDRPGCRNSFEPVCEGIVLLLYWGAANTSI